VSGTTFTWGKKWEKTKRGKTRMSGGKYPAGNFRGGCEGWVVRNKKTQECDGAGKGKPGEIRRRTPWRKLSRPRRNPAKVRESHKRVHQTWDGRQTSCIRWGPVFGTKAKVD